MSHVTNILIYDEKVDKKLVQTECDHEAASEGWKEGTTSLPRNIRWIDHVCQTYKEASEYLRAHDKGDYDQLAVKFKDTSEMEIKSAKKTKIERQLKAYREKMQEYDKKHSLANLKSELISCPECKSKLARRFLRTEGCPVCGTRDIRAEYIVEQLKKYREKISALEKELETEIEEIHKKLSKKAPTKWMVKIEYHV